MRLRTAPAPENPVAQAVAQAVQSRDPLVTRDAFASLDSREAETLLPIALQLLIAETRRPQRLALWIGGLSIGLPLLLMVIMAAFGAEWETTFSVIAALSNLLGAGVFIALLLWWQVTSRWLMTRQAAVRIAARLQDPASLSELINLVWLSRRRRDVQVTEAFEAALVRLLSRFDPELYVLPERAIKRLLVLTEQGSDDLKVATLLTLASMKEPLILRLAKKFREGQNASERVLVAARECLEILGRE